uniref:Endonuclease V n=1 Tax=Chenopodium quinoa TaxID=63459 RepID=A0A803LYW7_CHEQI
MEQSSSSSSNHQHHWIEVQDELKKKLIKEDGFSWEIPSSSSSVELEMGDGGERKEELKYVGGVDISFLKEDPSVACGTLVVLELDSLNVVYDDFSVAKLHIPYVPGFLAFREAPILLKLLDKMKKNAHSFYPQLLMVDGNGILHPRGSLQVHIILLEFVVTTMHGFGLACHLGVMADLPTIGIGKNLHHVEGLNHSEVRDLFKTGDYNETVYLNGNSGQTLGVAMRSTLGALKPIYISIGHRISLTTAMKVVKLTCKYRVPEPIRQ